MDLRKIAKSLERQTCKRHGKKPVVTVLRDSIELQCCCETFENQLIDQIEGEMTKQIDSALGF